jgi:hypothetical protein
LITEVTNEKNRCGLGGRIDSPLRCPARVSRTAIK